MAQKMLNVVKTDNGSVTFHGLEGEVSDLVRLADLALFLCHEELVQGQKITEDGCTLVYVAEQLAERAKALKKNYYAAWDN